MAGLARPLARPGRLERVPARPPAANRASSVSSLALLAPDETHRGGCYGHHLLGQLRLSSHSGVLSRGSPGKLPRELAAPGSPPPEPRPPPSAGDRTAARPGGVAARSPEPAEPAKPALLASVRFPASSARGSAARGPLRNPATARAQSAGARSTGHLGPRAAAGQPAGLGRDAGCAVRPGARAMAGARCRTLYPFSGERHSQGLRFAAGELLTLLQVPDGGWWEGEKDDGLRGWFPASYVQLLEVRGQGRNRGPATLQTSRLGGRTVRGRGWGVDSVLLLPRLLSTSWPLRGSENLLPVRVLEQAGALPRMTGATKGPPSPWSWQGSRVMGV